MKVTLSPDQSKVNIEGSFNAEGVPTKAAEENPENDGLNHGSTGFPVATGCRFKGADGKERELYIGVNITSHLVKGSKAKPKF